MLHHLRAAFTLLLLVLTLLCWAIPVHLPALMRLLLPSRRWKEFWTKLVEWIFFSWMATIAFGIRLLLGVRWEIRGAERLSADRWYFVTANHQAWTDIPLLFTVLHNRIPALKFFLKQELIWVPIVGTACWAFDFPFMKRYSSAYLKKHPKKMGTDLEATRKACERYKFKPVSIIDFVEGTRFTPEKKRRQSSPYRHLLRPRAGGMAFAMAAMDGKISHLLDVDIVYAGERKQLWDFIGGRIPEIIVQIRQSRIPDDLLRGDYLRDSEFRRKFQQWLNELWERKDAVIDRLLSEKG
jgi:1-acyl-sn-glycerol-3-phosphate acyltransferase